jgi:hypothetical protein
MLPLLLRSFNIICGNFEKDKCKSGRCERKRRKVRVKGNWKEKCKIYAKQNQIGCAMGEYRHFA